MRIAYDGGTAESNHAQLTNGMHVVPAGDRIAIVYGDGADAIAGEFLTRLKAAAQMIGDHTDVVRATVKQNTDALKQAVADLTSVDDAAASDFRTATTIVTQTAADTTRADVQRSETYARNEGNLDGGSASSSPDGATGQTTPHPSTPSL